MRRARVGAILTGGVALIKFLRPAKINYCAQRVVVLVVVVVVVVVVAGCMCAGASVHRKLRSNLRPPLYPRGVYCIYSMTLCVHQYSAVAVRQTRSSERRKRRISRVLGSMRFLRERRLALFV